MSEVRQKNIADAVPPFWVQKPGSAYMTGDRVRATAGLEFVFLSRCPHCYNPTMFVAIGAAKDQSAPWARVDSPDGRIEGFMRVLLTYPSVEPLTPHPAWPEVIREDFNEARRLQQENIRPAFVLPQCRAVLDLIVRELGAPKGSLKSQINYLREKAIITKALADWAHGLREDANALLHEGKQPATKQEVDDYVAFIELLLHVTYELPQSIEEKKAVSER